MNKYKIMIKFKDGKELPIDVETETNPRMELDSFWKGARSIMRIGDFFIKPEEILWMKIEGDELEHSWNEVQDTGKEV